MRVIALCEGGPLDGQTFSVEEGEPLTSREDIVGVLYVPSDQAPTVDLQVLDDEFHWNDHPKVVVYTPNG